MFRAVMPLNLEQGHSNISSIFRVFWSEKGSALEYGEDFARIVCENQEAGWMIKGQETLQCSCFVRIWNF